VTRFFGETARKGRCLQMISLAELAKGAFAGTERKRHTTISRSLSSIGRRLERRNRDEEGADLNVPVIIRHSES
jgi:hypothetical protein